MFEINTTSLFTYDMWTVEKYKRYDDYLYYTLNEPQAFVGCQQLYKLFIIFFYIQKSFKS